MAPAFEPVTCFIIEDVADYWHQDRNDLPWPDEYNVGAIRDKRGPDGDGQLWVVTPLGPVDLNNPEQRWELTGVVPKITASPSIKVDTRHPEPYCWHGYLRDGVLTGDWEAHP